MKKLHDMTDEELLALADTCHVLATAALLYSIIDELARRLRLKIGGVA